MLRWDVCEVSQKPSLNRKSTVEKTLQQGINNNTIYMKQARLFYLSHQLVLDHLGYILRQIQQKKF